MSAANRKVLADLRLAGGRTALAVIAVAAGIAAFDAVLSDYAVLTRALDQGYRSTNPASATIHLDRADAAALSVVRADPEIAEAEPRRAVRGRIRTSSGWRNLMLFVVEDFRRMRVSTFAPETGSWPPRAGEILLERDAFQVARAGVGDVATVRTDQGIDAPLRIAGGVHDVGQAQARMENMVYAYTAVDTLPRLGEEPFLDQIKIVVARDPLNEAHVRRVADEVRGRLERIGRVVRRVEVPTPGRHPHAAIMGMLMLVMAGFGLFALVLAGTLVANLTAARMAAEKRRIGVMRAIGGSRGAIAAIYFREALAIGIAALAVAVPAGAAGARALGLAMARFLNFDVPSFAAPAWVYGLVALVGIAVPLLAAAWPVRRACTVPVRDALDDRGTSGSAFGTTLLDRRLAGMGGPLRPMALAVRNAFRRRGRLALTAGTIAAGGVFFMSALNVRASMVRTLDRMFRLRKADFSLMLPRIAPEEAIRNAAAATPGISGVEGWIVTEGSIAAPGRSAAPPSFGTPAGGGIHGGVAPPDGFPVVALPWNGRQLDFDLSAGRSLRAGDTNVLIANTSLAARYPRIRIGAGIPLRLGPATTQWRVVGIAREPFASPVAYIPKAFFDAFHPGMANRVGVVVARGRSVDAVKDAFDENLSRAGYRPTSGMTKAESRFALDQHMTMIYGFLVVVSALLGGVGALGLATTASLNVLERRRELGVLAAVGASPGAIAAIFAAEGAAVGLLGWAIAVVGAWPLGRAAGDFIATALLRTRLDFAFEANGAALWLLISIVGSALASIVPALTVARSPAAESLAYE